MVQITLTNEMCGMDESLLCPPSPNNEVSIVVEDIEQYENTRTGDRYTPETTVLSELHPKELDYLRSLSLERYNERNTGVSASIPKDPGRKLKRSSSYRGKKSLEKENHKLLAGGIFEVPLHLVLQIDAINTARDEPSTPSLTCIRDVKRKHKDEGGVSLIRNLTPRLSRRVGSLKARPRSISPINLATRFQNGAVDDNECLKVPNNLVCRSFSTPSTPLDSRRARSANSTPSFNDKRNAPPNLNDIVTKLSHLSRTQGSKDSLYTEKESDKLEVPAILQNCCQYILQNGLDQQGIFRVCGAKKQVRTLRAEFNATSNMGVEPDTSVHVVAGIIKEFLKELPEALLTKSLYQPFLHCREMESLEERLEAYKELVRLLPGQNRDTLQFLLQFFKVVAEHCEDRYDNDGLPIEGNKMDISNLAVVIGPNILHRRKRGGSDSKSQLAHEAWEAPIVIEVVKELIEHHNLLFTVDSDVRKEVLRMMHETKQSHFNDVMNGYTGVEEDSRGRLTPDCSLESKGESRSDLSRRHELNGSSGFVSGGCSPDSSESLQYQPCSASRDDCRMGYCDRQHSSPELNNLDLNVKTRLRLTRSLEKEGFHDSSSLQFDLDDEANSSNEGLSGKDTGFDLTPPSSPVIERSGNRNVFCAGRPSKSQALPGYGALSPSQTFTQFRLDKMMVSGDQQGPASPRLGESRRAAMKKGNNRGYVPPRKVMAESLRQSRV